MAIKGATAELNSATAHLLVSNGKEAIEFYEKAFGAELLYSSPLPGNAGIHAHMRVGKSMIMVTDGYPAGRRPEGWPGSPADLRATSVIIELYVDDADAAAKRAIDAGATVKLPFDTSFWGDRYGWVADPFGHIWALSSFVEEIAPEEVDKRMADFMKKMPQQHQQK